MIVRVAIQTVGNCRPNASTEVRGNVLVDNWPPARVTTGFRNAPVKLQGDDLVVRAAIRQDGKKVSQVNRSSCTPPRRRMETTFFRVEHPY